MIYGAPKSLRRMDASSWSYTVCGHRTPQSQSNFLNYQEHTRGSCHNLEKKQVRNKYKMVTSDPFLITVFNFILWSDLS